MMHGNETNPAIPVNCVPPECELVQAEFSSYLDGDVSGLEMAAIAGHLDDCEPCTAEFAALRSVQIALSALGPETAPPRMQAQIRAALQVERERGTHLPVLQRLGMAWREWMGAAAARIAGGATAAVLLLGGAAGFLAGPLAVQANDDAAHLTSPHYLYSQVPPRPIEIHRDVPVLVDAQVDTRGRVYDYAILAGPDDPAVKLRVEENLLSSVFRPATAFGVPVRGHVIMTYSGVSVRG